VLGVVGALPWLVWNARHHWASLHLSAGTSYTYEQRVRIFLSPVLQEDLGLRVVDSERWIVPTAIGVALFAALVGLFAVGAYRSRRSDSLVLYLVVIAFPLLYALSPKANEPGDPRYAVVLAPFLALIVAQATRTYRRAALVLAFVLALTIVGLVSADRWSKAHMNTPAVGPAAPRSLAALVTTLDRLHVNRVFANYWLAYRLDFDTNERIVAAESDFRRLHARGGEVVPERSGNPRWRRYEGMVRAKPHAFVFFTNFPPTRAVAAALVHHGYVARAVDGFVVYSRASARTAGGP
jgi:hypothetical protein